MQDILLLHGAIGASDHLQPLAEVMEKRGFRAHCITFSGHGSQAFATKFGIDQWVNEVSAFMSARSWSAVPVFGYSMGGYVALRLAQQAPEQVSKIATLATKFAWSPETARKEAAMLDPENIRQKVPHFAEALKKRHGNQWEELLQRTATMMVELGEQPLLDEVSLSKITMPVLLGLGDKDNMVSMEETSDACKALTHGQMYMLPATKHPIEMVPVNLLAEILVPFFS